MSKMLNCTGEELSHDMACPSTVEPFVVLKEGSAWFYDESVEGYQAVRVEYIIRLIREAHKEHNFKGIIVSNNPLGIALHEALYPEFTFMASVKRRDSNLHWYYMLLDRMQDAEAAMERIKATTLNPASSFLAAKSRQEERLFPSPVFVPPTIDEIQRDFKNIWAMPASSVSPSLDFGEKVDFTENVSIMGVYGDRELFGKDTSSNLPINAEISNDPKITLPDNRLPN